MAEILNLETHQAQFVTVQELAEYWGVSTKTIYRHIDKGALKASQLPGGTLRIPIGEARTYGNPKAIAN